VYTFDRGSVRSPSFACVGERRKQDLDAFGRVQLTEGGMQLRKRRVSQDVDRRTAPTRPVRRSGRPGRSCPTASRRRTPPPISGSGLRGEVGGRRRLALPFAGTSEVPPPAPRSGRPPASLPASHTGPGGSPPSSGRRRVLLEACPRGRHARR